ncbi:phytoene/squalene synthase family protein [Planococcus halotolerans]|uniref:Phytoene/squalene synthase family protein n=1 Tax=Planococcus halotolerans TaxID=2233542 RepID=A0A365L6L0_9BACL|nr:phytoene/squalene synthase family protein [Planococcus halotolerans]QHJ70251.1 squalene/phytoene synthase family protein [Planococcus halotolerans]RAZ81019.1 phytoene/squalene synthase family protein [Planococcus halotolerans]
MEINQAYRFCEEVIAANSKSFYKSFSMLPKEKRKAVWAIYAFCRTVDDIVDEGADPVRELSLFKQEFNDFLAGNFDAENPMWLALSDVFRNYDMDDEAYASMIAGQEMDLLMKYYRTVDDVLDYSYHVASSVGLMLLPVLAPGKTAILKEGAIALGYAMQITNILRDIDEDLGLGRVYLPAELMKKYNLNEEDLRRKTVTPAFVSVWEEMAKEAEYYYQKAFETINEYPVSSRIPVKGAGLVYREILTTIRKKDYNVFGQKHFVPDQSKQQILACL